MVDRPAARRYLVLEQQGGRIGINPPLKAGFLGLRLRLGKPLLGRRTGRRFCYLARLEAAHSPDHVISSLALDCRVGFAKDSLMPVIFTKHLRLDFVIQCSTATPLSRFVFVRGLIHITHAKLALELVPVSYTHLTLPTKRIV